MVVTLLLAGVVGTMNIDTPSASATTPPEIGSVRASLVCTALRHKVLPALGGLIFEDHLLLNGRHLMRAMSRDSLMGAGDWYSLHEVQLGGLVSRLGENLVRTRALIDAIENDSKDTKASEALKALRNRLQAIADSDNRALNVLSGTYETGSLNENLAGTDRDPMAGYGPPQTGVLSQVDHPSVSTSAGGLAFDLDANMLLTSHIEANVLPAELVLLKECR